MLSGRVQRYRRPLTLLRCRAERGSRSDSRRGAERAQPSIAICPICLMIGLFREEPPAAPASATVPASPSGSAATGRRAPPGHSRSALTAVSPRPTCDVGGAQLCRGRYQVLAERAAHPVWPPVCRGVVFEPRDDNARVAPALVARAVVSKHRAASLAGRAVAPGLQLPVQQLVPGGVGLGAHQCAEVVM